MARLRGSSGGAATFGSAELEELYAAHRLSLVRLAILLAYLRTSVVNGSRSALRRRRTARGYVAPHDAPPDGPEGKAVLAEEHREV